MPPQSLTREKPRTATVPAIAAQPRAVAGVKARVAVTGCAAAARDPDEDNDGNLKGFVVIEDQDDEDAVKCNDDDNDEDFVVLPQELEQDDDDDEDSDTDDDADASTEETCTAKSGDDEQEVQSAQPSKRITRREALLRATQEVAKDASDYLARNPLRASVRVVGGRTLRSGIARPRDDYMERFGAAIVAQETLKYIKTDYLLPLNEWVGAHPEWCTRYLCTLKSGKEKVYWEGARDIPENAMRVEGVAPDGGPPIPRPSAKMELNELRALYSRLRAAQGLPAGYLDEGVEEGDADAANDGISVHSSDEDDDDDDDDEDFDGDDDDEEELDA